LILFYGDIFASDVLYERFQRQLVAINPEMLPQKIQRISTDDSVERIGAVAIVVKRLLVENGGLDETETTDA
jgi:hypothetical protein